MTISTSKDDIGGSCGLLTLPPEVLILIGSFLDIKSVLNLSSASAAWRNLLYDEHLLWKALYHRYWLSSNKWKYVPSNALALKSLWLVLCVPFHFISFHFEGQLHFISFVDPISCGGGITHRDWRSGETCESWMESFKQRAEIENRWLHCKPNVVTLQGHEEEVYCLQVRVSPLPTGVSPP
jgi:hypothetical protein